MVSLPVDYGIGTKITTPRGNRMARGRFISRSICDSAQILKLINIEGRDGAFVFTWMIPHADCDGRLKADPRLVHGKIFSLTGLTVEKIESVILTCEKIGLVELYDCEGMRCLRFLGFERHQKIDKSKEAKSVLVNQNNDITETLELGESNSGVRGELGESNSRKTLHEVKDQDQVEAQVKVEAQVQVQENHHIQTSVDHNKHCRVTPDRVDGLPVPEVLNSTGNIEPSPPPEKKAKGTDRSEEIRQVYQHYATYHKHAVRNPTSKSKDWPLIRDRLAEGYTVAELCMAIDGCHMSPFHQGENDRNRHYDSLELIMRNADKVTMFIDIKLAGVQPVLSEKNLRSMRAIKQTMERHYGKQETSSEIIGDFNRLLSQGGK